MKASYAYGPVTVGYSKAEYDLGTTDAATDQDTTSYAYLTQCQMQFQ